VVDGPAGLLPFHRRLEPAEWRALRLKLKLEILGANVRRALSGILERELILVGGPAGDEELLAALTGVLPGTVMGRGNVAGVLGNRWAVAYGLTGLAARRD
jgi:sugar (pentulose or hexulose) kinase